MSLKSHSHTLYHTFDTIGFLLKKAGLIHFIMLLTPRSVFKKSVSYTLSRESSKSCFHTLYDTFHTMGFLKKVGLIHFITLLSPRSVFKRSVSYTLPQTSVDHLDAPSDWRPGGRGFNPRRGRQHSFVEIDHEIFSTVILSLLLIQEGQLSVSGERMCTILVNRLED